MTAPDNRPDRRSGPSLEQRAQALYHEACQRIDPVTIGRLRDARRQGRSAEGATLYVAASGYDADFYLTKIKAPVRQYAGDYLAES